MLTCRCFNRIAMVLTLIGLLITFAALHLTIDMDVNVSLSLYGILILLYLLIQIIFSTLNKRMINSIRNGNVPEEHKDTTGHVVNCVIPGFMEDKNYYKACLGSYLNLAEYDHMHIKHVLFIIDGDEEKDMYMKDIFLSVFPTADSEVIHLNKTVDELEPEHADSITLRKKYVCIIQPHKGKRHALYTGFYYSCIDPEVTAITTSDSDTIMGVDSVNELTLVLKDKRIHAATGYVDIFNDRTTISYLSRLRYFFACNLERSYESWTRGVLCMSGPLSIYRTEATKRFLDKWLNQIFWGKPCTYGDDRHLTNCILENGGQTVYTPYAKCRTETPQGLTRFLRQQLRWNKSSIRELNWTMKFITQHSIWMTVDVAYQTLYSLFIVGSILYVIYGGTVSNLLTYCYGLMVIAFLRSLYGVFAGRHVKYLLYSYYTIIYLFMMIPLRVFAMLRMTDSSWGNIGRRTPTAMGEWISVGLWSSVVVGGIGWKIAANYRDISVLQRFLLGGVVGYFLALWIIIKICATTRCRNNTVAPMLEELENVDNLGSRTETSIV